MIGLGAEAKSSNESLGANERRGRKNRMCCGSVLGKYVCNRKLASSRVGTRRQGKFSPWTLPTNWKATATAMFDMTGRCHQASSVARATAMACWDDWSEEVAENGLGPRECVGQGQAVGIAPGEAAGKKESVSLSLFSWGKIFEVMTSFLLGRKVCGWRK